MDGTNTMAPYQFHNIDEMLTHLNSYGRFQRIINVMFAIISIPACFHMLIMYFIQAEPEWKCIINNSAYCTNGTIYPGTNRTRCFIPRTHWEYTQPEDTTLITEFQLDCGKEWLASFANSIFFGGWAIGAIILGLMSNTYGRKTVIVTSSFVTLCVALISSFVPNIYIFICCRFILGVFVIGHVSLIHVLLSEFIDSKNRPFAAMIITTTYTATIIILGVKAYFIHKWRWLLRACSIPYFFVLAFYKFIPESIRWLYLHKMNKKLTEVCKRMAYWNQKELPDNFKVLAPIEMSKRKSAVAKIFRKRKNLKVVTVLMFNWFASSTLYYGFFLTAQDFGISMHLNFIIFSLVELPMNVIGSLCNDRFGRKKTIPSSVFIGALISFIIAFLPRTEDFFILRIILGVLGISFIVIAFNSLTTWSTEILTTDVRSVGIGIVAAAGRCGGIAAPWISIFLKMFYAPLPFLVIGVLGVISGVLMLILPETKGVTLKDESPGRNSGNSELT